jgi:hypothetical protein
MARGEASGEVGTSVLKNVAANIIVIFASALVVKVLNLSEASVLLFLIVVVTVTFAAVLRFALRIARSEVFVNVVANVLANGVTFFVPPVNAWVRAFPYMGAVAVVVVLFPMLAATAVGALLDGAPTRGVAPLVLSVWIAISGLFLYGGFVQPNIPYGSFALTRSTPPRGFGFRAGFSMLIYTVPTVVVVLALVLLFAVVVGVGVILAPGSGSGKSMTAVVLISVFVSLAATIWTAGWVVPWTRLFLWWSST